MKSPRRVAAVVGAAIGGLVVAGAVTAAVGIALFDAPCRLRSVDESEYVRANEEVLRSVPVYPGAEPVTTWDIGQPASDTCLPTENGPPYGSFSTTHVYELPRGTTSDDVLDFYDQQLLPAWRQLVIRAPGSNVCDVSYARGDVVLGLTACSESLLLTLYHAARS